MTQLASSLSDQLPDFAHRRDPLRAFAGPPAIEAPTILAPNHAAAWFVARTKPNREDDAVRSLTLRHVNVFMPRIIELDGNAVEHAPAALFPGYLFVHIDLAADFSRVIWAPGIRELVSLGGGPVPIDDAVVEQLSLRCDENGVVHVGSAPWTRGDRVEITEGPFTGLLATVETVMPRRRRIKLLIDFLARQTSVDMPLTAIKAL